MWPVWWLLQVPMWTSGVYVSTPRLSCFSFLHWQWFAVTYLAAIFPLEARERGTALHSARPRCSYQWSFSGMDAVDIDRRLCGSTPTKQPLPHTADCDLLSSCIIGCAETPPPNLGFRKPAHAYQLGFISSYLAPSFLSSHYGALGSFDLGYSSLTW